MIRQEGHIETQCKPLCCTKKHDTEESMDEVLWKYKRIQGITLVYRILVISLQLIKCYNVPDGEEDEGGGEQQRQHVAEGPETCLSLVCGSGEQICLAVFVRRVSK